MQSHVVVEDQIIVELFGKSDFVMESVVLIKWSEKSKVIGQCGSAQGNEGVESPQVMKIEKTRKMKGSSSGINSESLILEYKYSTVKRYATLSTR